MFYDFNMAWNNNPDDIKISEFNSAGFKMRRLDKIMDALNELDNNLKAFNPLYQEYNYILKFHRCENLFQEVESKLTEEERRQANVLRNALQYFIDNNPVWKTVREKIYPYKSKKVIDEIAFRIIRDFLSKYESLCRKLIDVHGMDTAYGEEEGLF